MLNLVVRKVTARLKRLVSPYIQPSINLNIHSPADPKIHRFIDRPKSSTTSLFVHPYTRPSVQQSIHLSIYPSIHPSVRPSVRPSSHPFIRHFLSPFFKLSSRLHIHRFLTDRRITTTVALDTDPPRVTILSQHQRVSPISDGNNLVHSTSCLFLRLRNHPLRDMNFSHLNCKHLLLIAVFLNK
jgi:hypothetical protein